MSELSDRVKAEIDLIFAKDGLDSERLKGVARRLADRTSQLAPCFSLFLYEAIETHLNPVLHLTPCKHLGANPNICVKGLDPDNCYDCTEYEPEGPYYSSRIDCDNCPFRNIGKCKGIDE